MPKSSVPNKVSIVDESKQKGMNANALHFTTMILDFLNAPCNTECRIMRRSMIDEQEGMAVEQVAKR